jgi:ABC-type nitrate/sulfonate/bicarbonate transport system substrate-binding protein
MSFGSRAPSGGCLTNKVRLGYQYSLWGSPVVIALELNLFKEHGVEVDAKRFPAGKDARDAVVANTRDIATVSGTPCEPFCALAESTLGMLARMGVNPKYISALDKYFRPRRTIWPRQAPYVAARISTGQRS